MLAYWRDLPEAQLLAGSPDADPVHERLSGFLFSTLVALDGTASLPGFDLVPRDDDEWPTTSINADVELHAVFPEGITPPKAKNPDGETSPVVLRVFLFGSAACRFRQRP